jgi:hypothetical protein
MAALVEHRCDGKCAEKHSCEAPGYDGTLCGKPATRALLAYKKGGIMDSFGKAYWFCAPHANALLRIAHERDPQGPEWDGR